MMVWKSRIFNMNVTYIKIILITKCFSGYKINLQIKYQKFMRELHVLLPFLDLDVDGNPSIKGIEAVHLRLDFTELFLFFVI